VLSSQIDKQELRRFYFAVVSVLGLLAIILPLVFQSPQKREWLPQETETILSLNVEQFERDDLPKRWRKDQAAEWQKVWGGLSGSAQRTPGLNLPRDAVRITRAMTTTEAGATREFVLVEARPDVSQVIRSIEKDKTFEKRTISGLPLWATPDFALARVGPKTSRPDGARRSARPASTAASGPITVNPISRSAMKRAIPSTSVAWSPVLMAIDAVAALPGAQ